MRRRWLVALPIAVALSAALAPGAAEADAPVKAGWWNAVGAGGVGAPLPTTADGDLHVGQGLTGSTAYAAVAYDLTGTVSSAVLELKLTNVLGTPTLAACPTKDTAWKPAQDGDMADAPAYDCTKGHAYGVVSATGDTVTFLLSEALQLGSSYSLAVVPEDGALPFQADLVKPGVASLTVSGGDAVGAPAAPAPPPAATGPSGNAPLAAGTVVQAPASAPLAAAPEPAVAAPEAPAVAPPATAAVAPAAAPVLPPVSNRERYIAGTMLALIAGALVWALQQPRPIPRLIGGLARANPPEVAGDAPVRGIGRFASARVAPARSLV